MLQTKMFKDALKNKYIVPAFNFANFEIAIQENKR